MRRAARRDENEPEIVGALEGIGVAVQRLNAPGVPDLLCYYRGRYFLVEVIAPEKAKRHRRTDGLTRAQVEWHGRWPGPVHKVRSRAQAIEVACAQG